MNSSEGNPCFLKHNPDYTSLAHSLVAHSILGYLQKHNLTYKAGVEKARANKETG
jgi:hypothetical protein